MADASDEVLARVENRVGLIVLNRLKAINSLTGSMVKTIQATLSGWEGDDDASAVMISGAGELMLPPKPLYGFVLRWSGDFRCGRRSVRGGPGGGCIAQLPNATSGSSLLRTPSWVMAGPIAAAGKALSVRPA